MDRLFDAAFVQSVNDSNHVDALRNLLSHRKPASLNSKKLEVLDIRLVSPHVPSHKHIIHQS